jgi:hypothetical protein
MNWRRRAIAYNGGPATYPPASDETGANVRIISRKPLRHGLRCALEKKNGSICRVRIRAT